jgi:hypothetical protein
LTCEIIQPKTEQKQQAISKRLLKRDNVKRKRLAEVGIDYEFDGYRSPKKAKKDEKQVEEEKGQTKGNVPVKTIAEVKNEASASADKEKEKKKKQKKVGRSQTLGVNPSNLLHSDP